MQQEEKITKINIDLLIPSKYQPRKTFNELSINDLANSIKEYGILNPLLVAENNGKYEIIAGERRYRAAKQAGLTEIPVIIKPLNEQKKAEIALIENLQRETLTPIEEAKSYQEIIKLGNLTQESLGKRIGKSQSAIANKIRLLNLPKTIQDALNDKKISERHARSLATLKNEEEQEKLLKQIIENKLTVKELDNIINQQSITEEEIKSAINDIMKSLNIIEEKEEKESDTMNNGNFFPNFNANMGNSNDMSLNTMNMQSMVQPQMPLPEQNVMPTPPMQQPLETITPMPIMEDNTLFGINMEGSQPLPQTEVVAPIISEVPVVEPVNGEPSVEQNYFNGEPLLFNQQLQETPRPVEQPIIAPQVPELPIMESAINEVSVQAPIFTAPTDNFVPPQPTEVVPPMVSEVPVMEPVNNEVPAEAPIFTAPTDNFTTPQQTEVVAPQVPETPIMEPINNEVSLETSNVESAPNFEIPVMLETPEITIPTENVDNVTRVKKLLEENGINYKSYGNEQGHCIIIEI